MIAMTRERAWAAATDAADRNMRENGRLLWDEEDYNIAVRTLDRLWDTELDLKSIFNGVSQLT
jgi:hypothetical protein